MARAFEAGVTTFDVARSYGYGEAERILGDFIKDKRTRVQIVTKAGILPARVSPLLRTAKSTARMIFRFIPSSRELAKPVLGRQREPGHFEPQELERSLTASLRALRTDYADVLLLHACGVDTVNRSDVLSIMGGFVRRGMVRRIGVAASARVASLWIHHGGEPTAEVAAVQVEMLPQTNLGESLWLANQPLGGGRLLLRMREKLTQRKLPAELALQFLLQRPSDFGAHCTVVSMLSEDHVDRAVEAFDRAPLSADLRHQFEGVLQECV